VPTGQLTLTGVPGTTPISNGQNGKGSTGSATGTGTSQLTGASQPTGSVVATSAGNSAAGSSANPTGQGVPAFAGSGAGGVYLPQGQLTFAASGLSPLAASSRPAVDLSSGLSTPSPAPSAAPAIDLGSGTGTPQLTPPVTVAVTPQTTDAGLSASAGTSDSLSYGASPTPDVAATSQATDAGLSAVPATSTGSANGGTYAFTAGSPSTASPVPTSTQFTNPPQMQGTDYTPDATLATDATGGPTSDSLSPLSAPAAEPTQWSAL
jgi:hypothetical protein